jgi:hypothetical protein
MEAIRRCMIIVVLIGEYVSFQWRSARPIAFSVHLLRVARNVIWTMLREKARLEYRKRVNW